MSGAMRKMGVYLGLVEDEHDGLETHGSSARARSYDREDRAPRDRSSDRYDYDDAEYEPQEAPQPVRRLRDESLERPAVADRFDEREAEPAPRPSHRITTLHPRTYNEARAVGEEFRGGNPVIMNLTEMDDADAKRLVDFAAGLTFGLRGSIERITTKVFLLSPQKVKVTPEDKARIADGDYPSRG